MRTLIVLSGNEDTRSVFIPDMAVQSRHNTWTLYSEIEGHNKDAYDTRLFRTIVVTGAIVMWLLNKFEKTDCPLSTVAHVYTSIYREHQTSTPNS